MQALVVTITACLAIAVVLGTDVFFTVVGRTALARASAPAVLEVMAISLAAQLVWLALYLTIAKPINARMVAAMHSGTGSADARALQVRWESILIYRSILLGTALCTLLLALTKEG